MNEIRVIRKRIKPPLKTEGFVIANQLGVLLVVLLALIGVLLTPPIAYLMYLTIKLTFYILGMVNFVGMGLAMYTEVYDSDYRALPRHFLYYPWGILLFLCGAGLLDPIFFP